MLEGFRRAVGRMVRKAFPNDETFGTFQSIVANLLSDSDACTKPYEQNAVVYACVRAIADNAARPYFEVYRERDGDEVLLPMHPVAQFFRRPNPWQSGKDFVALWSTYLDMHGGVAIVAPGRLYGQMPRALQVLPGQFFKAIIDKDQGLVGWRFTPVAGAPVAYSLEECLRVWYPDPSDPWALMPPHKAVQLDLDGDRMAALYNRAFFLNGAVTGGHLKTHGQVEEDEFDQMKARWNDKHVGPRNAHFPMLLQGGIEFIPSASTQRDAEYPWLRTFTREQAALVYGVPHEVLGIGKKTFENVDAAWRNFWRHKLAPRCDLFGESVSHWLDLPRQGLTLAPDYSPIAYMQEDLTEKIVQAQGLQQLGYSQAKINARLGLDMDDEPWANDPPPGFGYGGEDDYLPGEGETETTVAQVEDDEDEPVKALPAPEARKLHVCGAADLSRLHGVQKDALTKLDRIAATKERQLRARVRTHFLVLQREVVAKIRAKAGEFPTDESKAQVQKIAAADVLFSIAQANKGLRARVAGLLLELVRTGARSVREEAGLPVSGTLPAAIRRVHLERLNKIVIVNRTVAEDIRGVVGRLLGESATIQETQAAVIERFGMHRRNALRIARTEVQGAINEARAAQQEDDGVRRTEWLSSRDDEVRESHRINGQQRDLGDRFTNGLRWPGDQTGEAGEVINCRCRTRSIFEPDEFDQE